MNLKTIASYFFISYIWLSPLLGLRDEVSRGEQSTLYYADSQTYDRELGILILRGNVEFEHQGNVLEADYVTYNENTDIVTASGNVRLRQADGDIHFAEYVELTGDMKEGVILQLRTLLEDDSKIAALEGHKFEDRQELEKAVYTPCELCGDQYPTWQINAPRVVKDDKDIHFTDAQLRFLNIPVLYLPYVTQPLERRSGFLIPRPQYSTAFGASLEVPYYIALSQDKDMTITPIFFTRQNPLFQGQYRQAYANGFLRTDGSITKYRKSGKDRRAERRSDFKIPNIRGHILGEGEFNINEIWRARADGGWVSDKTFFRKYGFSGWKNEPVLASEGILEGFLTSRNYAAAKVYHFQGLQDRDRQEHISAPLPYLEYNGFSGIDPWGGRLRVDSNFLNLYRQSGLNMQRGIGVAEWRRPWVTCFGQVYTLFALVRGDLYAVEHSQSRREHLTRRRRDFKNDEHGFRNRGREERFERKRGGARFFPQTGLNWRWPFMNSFQCQNVVLQPVLQLIAAPDTAIGVKGRRIPNEDSTDFEFNDVNLFSKDRFPGYDRIDTGSRGIYGGEILTTGDLLGDVGAFFGQSYSFSKPNRRNLRQGFGRRPSDYVGRLQANPFGWLLLNYRFRLDQKTWAMRVTDIGASLGPEIARLTVDYVFISKHAATRSRREFNQINLVPSSKIAKHWTIVGLFKQDLKRKRRGGRTLEKGIGAVYRDDCFGLGISVKRQFYRDRDLRPETLFLVTLFLKNIGDYGYSFNISDGLFGERKTQNPVP